MSQSDSPTGIRVWADVGGTFTDCFVIQEGRMRAGKVLSSGVVRATLAAPMKQSTLTLSGSHAAVADNFWNGASISLLDATGRPRVKARIRHHNAATSTVELADAGPIWAEANDGDVVELDAGLEAPVLATRFLLGTPLADPLPPLQVRLGTTRGTNALLTRRGAATALLVTQGFADVLRIAEQNRPDLFALAIKKPQPLTNRVIEVEERLDASGQVLKPLDPTPLAEQLRQLKAEGIESLAVCLLHAYLSDRHEQVVGQLAREIGFDEISLSSEVAPLIKLVSRAETTTLDAYLNPILARYVAKTWSQFGGRENCHFRLMTSGGNLVAPEAFRGRDSILSGPAGGVVALGSVSRRSGAAATLGLDMGGTSTDVSRFEGTVGRRYESEVAGVHIMTPMMDIHTVAAGGGSICGFRYGRFHVGPDSAGADPGPASYGRGGPLTITDVNLLLGRIPADRFPLPLDRRSARAQLGTIVDQVTAEGYPAESPEAIAEGFLQIAVTHMAEAARKVSTAEGTDPRTMTLVGFGGAAGQHLCRVADALGMKRILDHPHAGMLSALGMGLASIGRVVTRGMYEMLDAESLSRIDDVAEELRQQATVQLGEERSGTDSTPEFLFECDLRSLGADSTLTLAISPAETLAERFHQKHHTTFGYEQRDRPIEIVCVRCEATLPSSDVLPEAVTVNAGVAPRSTTSMWFEGVSHEVEVIDRASLQHAQRIDGPAMIVSDHSTLLIEPNWQGVVLPSGVLELLPKADDNSPGTTTSMSDVRPQEDPVLLEVVSRRLQGIADSMGEVLRRTSVSVNVKERRDYSCAVFRGDGSLIANAPHVPVHLGAMGHTVRQFMCCFPEMHSGDCYLSNDPFSGGSHLPDVTSVTPVFCDRRKRGRPDFFVASRAHHAEIGGKTPGSMPPQAKSLAEEGVLIRDFALVRNGTGHHDALEQLLRSGRYPSRNAAENLADIAAQQAAGNAGVAAMQRLTQTYSTELVDGLMGRLLEVAGDSIAEWVETLTNDSLPFADRLDDGTRIAVAIQRHNDKLVIDFSGTDGVHPYGFNATPSIVTAAVLYVLRCVSGADLPLCDGVLRDIDLRVPTGLLNPPRHEDPERCAAVVAGNVETSQRVVDVLLGALRLAAASQGTMNNLLIGDDSFGYYETIGGGSGATSSHAGADAVHTHMTNTRITDPEVLESRLPLRLHQFSVRKESGGKGQFCGGDGILREIEFLKPLDVSLITNRRTIAPYGVDGGDAGACGRNRLRRSSQWCELPPTTNLQVDPGDRLIIETPGGGGWGGADRSAAS